MRFPSTAGLILGVLLALGLIVLAVGFAVVQELDRRRRGPGLSSEDRAHFTHQDRRRWLGSVVMMALAGVMGYGLSLDPRHDRQQGRLFLLSWTVAFALLLLLLGLAAMDWFATRRYARRHRAALRAEGLAAAEDLARWRRQGPPPSEN